jgi:hypothetical protein
MKNFRTFLEEYLLAKDLGNYYISEEVAHIFDMDGTIYNTKARIKVKNEKGETVQHLTHAEYNTHSRQKKLKPGEHYDFGEFRSSHAFAHEKPIPRVLHQLKSVQNKKGEKTYINTARPNLDNKKVFLHKLRHDGINTKKVHVDRVGNMHNGHTVAQNKASVISKRIKQNKLKEVNFYDDDKYNLRAFLKLRKKFPTVKLHAHHITKDGKIKHFHGDE